MNHTQPTSGRALRVLSALALAALTACGGGGGGEESPVAETPAPPVVVASPAPVQKAACGVSLYGDSILHGAFNNAGVADRLPEPPYAALQRLRPAYVITDFSINGDAAVAHVGAFLNDTPPGVVVVIEYLANDASSNANPVEYESAMRAMVQRVKALGKAPLVTGASAYVGVANRELFNGIALRVAQEEGAAYADWNSVGGVDLSDAVHPNQPYSTRLVERLVDVLDLMLPECKRPAQAA